MTKLKGQLLARWPPDFAHGSAVWLQFDDAMDIFAAHGLAGMVGLIMTGFFAQGAMSRLLRIRSR
jgi:ammonia channel protein AmtB